MTETPAGTPLRVMFDSNAHDAILTHDDVERLRALIDAGALAVITTHVQEDEIRQIADAGRRNALLDILRRLDGTTVDPAAVIGKDTTHMARDRQLAGVALAACDLFVTDDRTLASTCANAVSYAEFRKRLA